MSHSVPVWRLFMILMVASLMSACASRIHTSETVEVATSESRPPKPSPRQAPPRRLPVPAPLVSRHPHVVLDHKYFVVFYDQKYRLARWVKYEMTKESLAAKSAKRRNRFKADPMLAARGVLAVLPREYKKTGYDQGHLAPSADFAFSQEANDATFVMSNMVPQKPKLNRVSWRLLEEQVRKWACGEEKVTVVTGPVIEEKLDLLPSGLPIPRAFFKIVFDETPPRKAIAFLYRQEDYTNVINDRIIDLKKLDGMVGEDFSSYLQTEERRPAQTLEWKECEI